MAHDAQPDAIGTVDDDLPAQPTQQASADKASKGESPEVLTERCEFLYRRITPAIVATVPGVASGATETMPIGSMPSPP